MYARRTLDARALISWRGVDTLQRTRKYPFDVAQRLQGRGRSAVAQGHRAVRYNSLAFRVPVPRKQPRGRTCCFAEDANTSSGDDDDDCPGPPPPQAEASASGLVSLVLEPGVPEGRRPGPRDTVSVHYLQWRVEGRELVGGTLDAGGEWGPPVSFRVGSAIRGWAEGLELMALGESRRLWIPASLAYGDRTEQGAPSGDLVMDVQLLKIQPASESPDWMFKQKKARTVKSPWSFLDKFIP